jgi:hypothetical protein
MGYDEFDDYDDDERMARDHADAEKFAIESLAHDAELEAEFGQLIMSGRLGSLLSQPLVDNAWFMIMMAEYTRGEVMDITFRQTHDAMMEHVDVILEHPELFA